MFILVLLPGVGDLHAEECTLLSLLVPVLGLCKKFITVIAIIMVTIVTVVRTIQYSESN
jgi:hypothetical protein